MTHQSLTQTTAASGADSRGPNGLNYAQSFSSSSPSLVDIQARIRFREPGERASISASGVPRPRVQQILETVLRMPCFDTVPLSQLRVDVHRADTARWSHNWGLALALAMVSSLTRRPIPSQHLLLGDLDLRGGVRDVPSAWVDSLNDAIEQFDVESPVTVLLASESAKWMRSSSTRRVVPCVHLRDAVAALWPNQRLFPQ